LVDLSNCSNPYHIALIQDNYSLTINIVVELVVYNSHTLHNKVTKNQ
jgi:hypothetical protein